MSQITTRLNQLSSLIDDITGKEKEAGKVLFALVYDNSLPRYRYSYRRQGRPENSRNCLSLQEIERRLSVDKRALKKYLRIFVSQKILETDGFRRANDIKASHLEVIHKTLMESESKKKRLWWGNKALESSLKDLRFQLRQQSGAKTKVGQTVSVEIKKTDAETVKGFLTALARKRHKYGGDRLQWMLNIIDQVGQDLLEQDRQLG